MIKVFPGSTWYGQETCFECKGESVMTFILVKFLDDIITHTKRELSFDTAVEIDRENVLRYVQSLFSFMDRKEMLPTE